MSNKEEQVLYDVTFLRNKNKNKSKSNKLIEKDQICGYHGWRSKGIIEESGEKDKLPVISK